jgi:hypothetical protein
VPFVTAAGAALRLANRRCRRAARRVQTEANMSNRIKWMSLALILLGVVVGSQFVRAAGRGGTVAAVSISPNEITRAAKDLPIAVPEALF